MRSHSRSWCRVGLLSAVVVGSLLLLGTVALHAFGEFVADEMCFNTELQRSTSPDAALEIVVFERDCGATTGFSTQASVVSIGVVLANQPGNIWVLDDNHGRAPMGPGGGPVLSVRWTGARSVVLSHAASARRSAEQTSPAQVGVHFDTF